MTQYRVVPGPGEHGSSSRLLRVQVRTDDDAAWVDLDRWREQVRSDEDDPELFADDLAAVVAKHGWRLGNPVHDGPEDSTGDHRGEYRGDHRGDSRRRDDGDCRCWTVSPLDWRQIIALGTQNRRDAAEQAAQIDRGWQTMIADVPRSRVTVVEIAEIAGLTRARIHKIRQQAGVTDDGGPGKPVPRPSDEQ